MKARIHPYVNLSTLQNIMRSQAHRIDPKKSTERCIVIRDNRLAKLSAELRRLRRG